MLCAGLLLLPGSCQQRPFVWERRDYTVGKEFSTSWHASIASTCEKTCSFIPCHWLIWVPETSGSFVPVSEVSIMASWVGLVKIIVKGQKYYRYRALRLGETHCWLCMQTQCNGTGNRAVWNLSTWRPFFPSLNSSLKVLFPVILLQMRMARSTSLTWQVQAVAAFWSGLGKCNVNSHLIIPGALLGERFETGQKPNQIGIWERISGHF